VLEQICKLGIFPGYFADFVILKRTGFVLRFTGFVVAERADFSLRNCESEKFTEQKIVSHVHG
jgi:hypothetical protein